MTEGVIANTDLPFEVGALYNRREQIHDRYGGQRQGGISTPSTSEFVILFTGEAGQRHGYHDHWEEDGLHYYGEGQSGDMTFTRGNLAIREHLANRKRLLLFQMMGHGRPYRFLGEFRFLRTYVEPGVDGNNGLLLTPHADHLFDRGWITFEDSGALVRSEHLPVDVMERIGLNLKSGRRCGDFAPEQSRYLEFHRNAVFDRTFKQIEDPISDIFSAAGY